MSNLLSEPQVQARAIKIVEQLDGLTIGEAIDILHAAKGFINTTNRVDAATDLLNAEKKELERCRVLNSSSH